MKRLLTMIVLMAAIMLTGPSLLAEETATGATVTPDHVTLTWTGNPATTMTITWRTDTTVTTGCVQYDSSGQLSSNATRANAKSSTFSTDIGDSKLFTTTLTGLAPGTKYTYRVGDGQHWSEAHTFSTAAPSVRDFSFLVFGDSQSVAGGTSPYSVWRETVHNAYKANPGAKFMVNVGDLVDAGQIGAHWNGWFAAAKGVIDTVPVMPAVGNHETTGSARTRRPEYWNAQFRLPQNGPACVKNQAYSYDYGQVHLVVLDSQYNEQRQYGDLLEPQRKWLDADLAASKATWKVVFFHKPAYSVKGGRDNKAIRDAFSPIMEKYGVNLVFNAHDHGVGRTYPIKNGKYMSKPSEGTTYYVVGRSGTKVYHDNSKQEWNAFFYNPLDQPNYLVVEVSDAKLTVRAIKQDGTPIDTYSIDRD